MRIAMSFAIALLVSAAAHGEEARLPCGPGDKDCARAAAKAHVSKRPDFWKGAMARPVGERIGPAPPELLELLALDNIAHGYPNKPRPARLTKEFLADVRRAFDEIPAVVKRRLDAKLAGIYFADDFGGTGFTDQVDTPAGAPPLGFIVLDPSVLMQHTANAWATWKDSTPFKPDRQWRLVARIAEPAQDDRAHAIQYILLHEIAHVLSIGAGIHPSWTIAPRDAGAASEYPFFKLSWRIAGNHYASAFDAQFARRKDVVFYFGARLEAAAMPATYAALERTNFATLYGATHPADDFAEALANYVHVVLMGKPFEIRVERNARPVTTYRACWAQARCRDKRQFLERFLGG